MVVIVSGRTTLVQVYIYICIYNYLFACLCVHIYIYMNLLYDNKNVYVFGDAGEDQAILYASFRRFVLLYSARSRMMITVCTSKFQANFRLS